MYMRVRVCVWFLFDIGCLFGDRLMETQLLAERNQNKPNRMIWCLITDIVSQCMICSLQNKTRLYEWEIMKSRLTAFVHLTHLMPVVYLDLLWPDRMSLTRVNFDTVLFFIICQTKSAKFNGIFTSQKVTLLHVEYKQFMGTHFGRTRECRFNIIFIFNMSVIICSQCFDGEIIAIMVVIWYR